MPYLSLFYDRYYLLLVLPAVILSIWAQIKVKSTFAKYSRVQNRRGLTGEEVARMLLKANRINDVAVEGVAGSLSDHYDPREKVLRLSSPVGGKASIAAVGVAAHETGHAIQHARAWKPLGLRSALVPVANLGSFAGPWLAIAGIVMQYPLLINIGIALFGAAVAFYLVTLPVEFDASRRAIALLRGSGVLSEDELKGVKKVLTAAALTYVASALTALMSLLRLILLSRDRGGRGGARRG
ncbi:MAG: zinc metallopeptidase [Treponema sp.]|jgi:Zn-dependent membrane protease YugP|nr:zinc metallopeptidase [Treponema sp.]